MKKLIILLALFIVSCEAKRQAEDNDMENEASLTLTAANHPHGFSQTECFACHIPQNIHLVDRLGSPSFPLARALVESQGLSSCQGCHGSNGVNP